MAAARTRDALTLQPQYPPGIRPFRHAHSDRAGRRRHCDFAAQHRFAKRDRQFDMDVVALAGEKRIRSYLDFDQCIAGRTAADAWPALAAQPQNLTIASARRNVDVED